MPTSRVLAACSSLAGLITVMTEPSPSAAGILAALACLLLWAAFSSVPTAKKQAIRITTRKRPPSETVDPPPTPSLQPAQARSPQQTLAQSRQPAPAQPLQQAPVQSPQPSRATPKATPMRSSKLSSVPTHRQRITDRRTFR